MIGPSKKIKPSKDGKNKGKEGKQSKSGFIERLGSYLAKGK